MTAPPRHVTAVLAVVAVILVAGVPARGAAEPTARPYVGFRLGAQTFGDPEVASGVDASDLLDAYGLSVGVDLGRHLGVEVMADYFEAVLRGGSDHGSLGELGVLTLIPQVRLRLPLLDGRLVPYAVAGVGIGHTEYNDRKPSGFGRRLGGSSTGLAWTAGIGAEYFFADNLSFGVEGRWLGLPGGYDLEVDGDDQRLDLGSFVAHGVLRAYFAEPGRRDPGPRWLPSLAARAGGAVLVDRSIARGLRARPEHASIAGHANQLYGFTLGFDLTRALAVELAGDGYEVNLEVPGRGLVGEYGFSALVPQLRVRWPLLDGRLVPSAVGGVGLSYAEFNDLKPRGDGLDIRGKNFGVVGVLGAALDYRVVGNIEVGVEARYAISRGHRLTVAGDERTVTLDAVLTTAVLRVHFR
jgi:opacity protein-like surface antigen